MGAEFVGQVSRTMLIALTPLAVGCGFFAGWPGAVGGLAGALISLASFRHSSIVACSLNGAQPSPVRLA